MMRVGIDNISPGLSTTPQALGGMRHWLEGVVNGLARVGPEHEFELFSPTWFQPFTLAPGIRIIHVPDLDVPKGQGARAVYEQFRLPGRIRQRGLSVWLGTCNTLPIFAGGRAVLIIQSVQYRTHPETFAWGRRIYLRTMLRWSVRRADAIVVFSGANKKQIVRWFGVDEHRVHVIPHACRYPSTVAPASAQEQREVYALTGGPYILSVSAFYAYKNLHRLIEAYARLERPLTHRLVLAGSPTAQVSVADITANARHAGVEDDVVCLGRVPDDVLPKLYRHATLMAMPSLEETFGFPALEAMALGCPVVTSNLSSMPEIVADAGLLVDPYDVDSIAEGLRQVLASPDRRTRMIDLGRARAATFTYDRFSRSLLRVLESTARP